MTCPVCHRTEIMPGCPNSGCPARERTPVTDLGPSIERLLEIGALQERVRVLEAMVATARTALVVIETLPYHNSQSGNANFERLQSRAETALSEMAAADAELL